MGLISEIRDVVKRKRGNAPPIGDQIAAVNAAMARLRQEREAAETSLSAVSKRRRELLLEDASDDTLAELEREADRLAVQLERIETVEPEVLAHLRQLQGDAQKEQWDSLVCQHDEFMKAYLDAAKILCTRYIQVLAVWESAEGAGFSERFHRFVLLPHPHVVHPDVLNRLERELSRVTTTLSQPVSPVAPQPKPATVAAPPVTGPTGAAEANLPALIANGHGSPARANGHDFAAPPAPAAKRRPGRPRKPSTPPGDGEVCINILRPGVEIKLEDGTTQLLGTGDRINLPMPTARELMLRGAADFVTEA